MESITLAGKKYIPIPTDSLLDNTSVPFDVYAPVENGKSAEAGLVLYAKAPYRWTLKELRELLNLGIQVLYIEDIHKADYQRYLNFGQSLPKVNENLAPVFRIMQIQDIGKHYLESCFLTELNDQTIQDIKYLSEEIVLCLQEDPSCVRQIQTLCEHSMYTYIHCMGTGVLCAAIAKQLGENDTGQLTLYAMAGIFHDIGKKDVPKQILEKSGPLTPEEWEAIKAHPTLGLEALTAFQLPQEIFDIVGLHHEKLDGSGYPHNLAAAEIPFHVQIATVADIFSALTTSRSYHFKRSRFEALMFMKHELKGKINKEAFEALVRSLIAEKEQIPD